MNELIGFAVVLALFVGLPLAGAWSFFHHVGRRHNITTLEAAKNYLRKDLDAGPLTPGRLNLTYRARMRASGIKGPSGKVMPVSKITLEMPAEDYRVAKQFGISEFTAQLAEYRHTYALKQGWVGPEKDPVPVTAWPNETLKRLRPRVSFEVAQDGITRTLTAGMDATEPFGSAVSHGLAWITFKGKQWTLQPGESPYRLGRAEGNQIRTVHDMISSHHANLVHSRNGWVLEPLKTTNATKLNGRTITAPTPLTSGAIITIGAAEPIRFDDGTAVISNGTAR